MQHSLNSQYGIYYAAYDFAEQYILYAEYYAYLLGNTVQHTHYEVYHT